MKHRIFTVLPILLVLLAVFSIMLPVAIAEDATTIKSDTAHVIVAVGKAVTPKLTISPSKARKAGVTYQSSNETIATVDSRGKIKGIALGECELSITSKHDRAVNIQLPISVVIPVAKLVAQTAADTIHVGETTVILCTYAPEEATMKQATYASSKKSIATVDASGVVTGISNGRTDITVTSVDGKAKARVRIDVLQQPISVSISPESLSLPTGKTGALKATVLPKNTNNKNVTWSTSDASIATVDSRGRVTCIAPGIATITATCDDNPSVSASVTVAPLQLAGTVDFGSKKYSVIIGQTAQTAVTVGPENTTNKAVTYKVKDKRILSVDPNGVVTGLKGGKTTLTAIAVDGSKHYDTTTVEVHVPVTGVRFKRENARVGVNYHANFTATLEPEHATNHNMVWVSSDESVATVKGDNNRVRISGRKWGHCQVTGTTEDGGFTCTLNVNVGSLRQAVVVRVIEIRNGKPYIVLQNKSNMDISNIYYEITGTDVNMKPVNMSTKGATLNGVYAHTLTPMEKTRHGSFRFIDPSNYPKLQHIQIAVIGWETSTGYKNSNGVLEYSYTISQANREWVNWDLK